MRIVVLAGGRSTERNVSLSSGAKITDALRSKGNDVVMVDLFLGYDLTDITDIHSIFTHEIDPNANYDISDAVLTDADIDALRTDGTRGLFGKNVLDICMASDIVFLALHGEDGENGKVQGMLDLYDIRYTGSGQLASAITMSKKISKEVMLQNNIKTAPFVTAYREEVQLPKLPFGFPAVVKPSNGGSSIGTHIVQDEMELKTALADAFRFDREVLIEQFIKGREFSLGVVAGHAFPAIEIMVPDGWYDFQHKFQNGQSTQFETPPNNLPDDVHEEMKHIAIKTARALGLQNYSRTDFLYNDSGLYVIESNSLPGMTPLSLLPQEANAEGVSYPDLCEAIVEDKVKLYETNETN